MALRLAALGEYLDALDHGFLPDDARFSWFRGQAPLRLAHEVVQYALEDQREAPSQEDALPRHGVTGPERLAEAAKAKVAAIVRDIFGNPFHPSPPLPASVLAWNDGTVRRLAQAIYDVRDMPAGTLDAGRLGVLADALLDAGCEDEEVVQHLREPGAHVRGCWAVDAILGRE
jgi:hypothetical protein